MVEREKVEKILDQVRPSLQMDGGDVELVDVKDLKVYIRLQGHCRGCFYSQMTIKNGIEKILRKNLGEEVEVISID